MPRCGHCAETVVKIASISRLPTVLNHSTRTSGNCVAETSESFNLLRRSCMTMQFKDVIACQMVKHTIKQKALCISRKLEQQCLRTRMISYPYDVFLDYVFLDYVFLDYVFLDGVCFWIMCFWIMRFWIMCFWIMCFWIMCLGEKCFIFNTERRTPIHRDTCRHPSGHKRVLHHTARLPAHYPSL